MGIVEMYEGLEPPDNWSDLLDDYSFSADRPINADVKEALLKALAEAEDNGNTSPEAIVNLVKTAWPNVPDEAVELIRSVAAYPTSDGVSVDTDGDGDIDKTFKDDDKDGAIEVESDDKETKSAEDKNNVLSDATMKNIARTLASRKF